MALKRYVFKLVLYERIDALDEEDAREKLERPDEWELMDVIDVPTNQITKNLDKELEG